VLDRPRTGIDSLVDVCTHVWGVWGVFSVWLQADMELTTKCLRIRGYWVGKVINHGFLY
jgi:hypothetical protein